MSKKGGDLPGLRTGEQPVVERVSAGPVVTDTFAGRIHVEWDGGAAVTPLGQLPFFIEYLKQGGLFDGFVGGLPVVLREPQRAEQARCTRHGDAVRCWRGIGVTRT